jgi:hypothetical protein
MRFCSGCGYPLDATSQLLVTDGMPTLQPSMQQPPHVPEKKPRPKGVKIGVILMLMTVVLFPLVLGLVALADHPAPLIIPFTLFLAGLATAIYSWIFKDASPPQPYQQAPRPFPVNHPVNQPPALPPGEAYGVRNFNQPVNTAEMVNPPSVTESTTTLFDKERPS